MLWVTVKDVVVPGRRWAAPDVCRVESSLLDVAKILDDDRVVDSSAIAFGLEVLY